MSMMSKMPGLRLVGFAASACLLLLNCQRQPDTNHSVDTTLEDPVPALLRGELSYPSDYIPNDMRVCAEDISSGQPHCDAQIRSRGRSRTYDLSVPAGRYRVYATTSEWPNYKAYYSEAVTCGLHVGCTSHEPIIVTLRAGETKAEVNPHDWYAATPPPTEASTEDPPAKGPSTADNWSPEETALMSRWHELNTLCRGGSGDRPSTHAACEERDGPIARQLADAGICYGREGEYGYQMAMHRCGPASLR